MPHSTQRLRFVGLSPTLRALQIYLLNYLFEIGICIIQAHIFCLLISLYKNDHQ